MHLQCTVVHPFKILDIARYLYRLHDTPCITIHQTSNLHFHQHLAIFPTQNICQL